MQIYTETLRKANISISGAGDNTIISAPTEDGQYIVIDHINFVPAGAVNVQLKDGTTAYGGLYSFAQNQGFVLENAAHNDDGVITLSPKTAFVMNLSAGVQVSGFIRYRLKGGI